MDATQDKSGPVCAARTFRVVFGMRSKSVMCSLKIKSVKGVAGVFLVFFLLNPQG